jgi:hypothetical protein
VGRAALSDDDLVAIRQSPGPSHGLRLGMPQASGHDGTRLQSGIIPIMIPDPRFAGDRGSIPRAIPRAIPDLPGIGDHPHPRFPSGVPCPAGKFTLRVMLEAALLRVQKTAQRPLVALLARSDCVRLALSTWVSD